MKEKNNKIESNLDEKLLLETKEYIMQNINDTTDAYIVEQKALFLLANFIFNVLDFQDIYNWKIKMNTYTNYMHSLNEITINEVVKRLESINLRNVYFPKIFFSSYISKDLLKKNGEFFTPAHIIKYMINRVEKYKELDNSKIFDFSVGNGAILYELINKNNELKKLVGNDIQEFCTFLTEVNVKIAQILCQSKCKEEISNFDTILQHDKFTDKFDIVISNPPYIGQKNNKALFEAIRKDSYWNELYTSKSDYLYYFMMLGIKQLKEGGLLCLITPQYWLTATKANKLRRYIIENMEILEIHDFDKIKLFPNAKGQENIIILLRKSVKIASHNIKIYKYNTDLWKQNKLIWEQNMPEYYNLLENNHTNIGHVYWSKINHNELGEEPWYVLSEQEQKIKGGKPLEDFLIVQPGIQTGCDYVNKKNTYVKSNEELLRKQGINLNDGIYVVNSCEMSKMNLDDREKSICKRFFKVGDIEQNYLSNKQERYLIYAELINNIEDFPNIKKHLEKFREILKVRFKTYSLINDEKMGMWWKLVGARPGVPFEGEKIIHPYRATEPCFIYSNREVYSSMDIFYSYKKEGCMLNLKFISAVLNSTPVKEYLKYNCKMKGIKYELYKEPVSKIPMPNVDLNDKITKKIYDYISGEYSCEEKGLEYKYHSVTNTWIKHKGLLDRTMEIVYNLKELEDKYNININYKENVVEGLSKVEQLEEKEFILRAIESLKEEDINNIKKCFLSGEYKQVNHISSLMELSILIDLCSEYLYNLL